MLNTIKTTAILFVATLGVGCNDYLDIPTKGSVIPESVQDFREMMNNYDGFIRSSCNLFYPTDDIKIYKDDMGFIYDPKPYINGYCWNNYMYNGDELQDRDWNNFYAQILICNTVISGIDEASGGDDQMRTQVKAEALAQRAYAYFMLVNIYAEHYNAATSAADLAVPLYIEGDGVNDSKARATVAEVYAFIERDLLLAEKTIAERVNFSFKPSKAAVRGLLSLIYLYQGRWQEAADYASEALKTNSFLYKFADMDYMLPMPGMKWLGVAGYPTNGHDNKEIVWHKYCIDGLIYIINVYMSDELRAMYEPTDRRVYFNQIDAGMFGKNKYGDVIFNINQGFYKCGITTPLLYLIRAEAYARLKKGDLALADINTLREHRLNAGAYTPYLKSQYTDDQILKIVLEERRKELFLECWRWIDLKRLNKDPRFAKTLTRTFDGKSYTIAPTSPNYVMAIPKNVCNFNKKIIQNKREH